MDQDETVAHEVTRKELGMTARMPFVADRFGVSFPLRIEPTIFNIMSQQVKAYSGAYWNFYKLSNDGFYMAPSRDNKVEMVSENGAVREVSYDAAGIVACLFAFSILSFSEDTGFGRVCAEHFHQLRDYAASHREAPAIFALID